MEKKNSNTQGRKGQKLPRINMAFYGDNLEYVQEAAHQARQSVTEYINHLIAKDREKACEQPSELQERLDASVESEKEIGIRGLTNALLEEYNNDKTAAYAHVCNHTFGSNPDETLLAIKRELEHRFALDAMEEYFWEQTDTGEWRKLENDEFWARFYAARKRSKE